MPFLKIMAILLFLSIIAPKLLFAKNYKVVSSSVLANFHFCPMIYDETENVLNGSAADTSKTKKDSLQSSSPRDGKYLILSYGSNPANPLKLGYFILGANQYKYYDLESKLLGEGTYVYDVTEKQIRWQTGPFKTIGWSGDFSIDNNGKTHTIRLKNNSVGTNSIE